MTPPTDPAAAAAPSRALLATVFALVACWALLGAGAQATYGARVTADEPQYLLSAISLVEDGDLDIADELAEQRWRAFHRVDLPRQTEPRPDGSELSPHDPLLPVLLAPGVAVAQAVAPGWEHAELAGARVVLALLSGALAAVLWWTAEVRLGVRRRTTAVVVASVAAAAPIAAYGHQLYPELPAALAVAVAAAALLAPCAAMRRTGWAAAWVVPVVALPWLGVKYVPVAAALAVVGLGLVWCDGAPGGRTRRVASLVVTLLAAGVGYLALHRVIYGGWTVYAAGDHFVDGELTVVGTDPDHVGRTARLVGLLVDRHFGIAAWAPVWLLAVPAVGAVARARDRVAATLVVPLAAGWATATWVALTMHGWWWPGRQVVVVLPLAALALARFLDRRPRLVGVAAAAGVLGVLSWAWVATEATFGRLRLIVDFDRTAGPWLRVWRTVLPDGRSDGIATLAGQGVWSVILVGGLVLGWRHARPGSGGGDEDALAGEGADADAAALDLDRGRPVG